MKSLVILFLLTASCGVAVGLTREYIFKSYSFGWYNAQWYCREHFKDLATITTTEEMDQLVQSGPGNSGSWIGMHKTYLGWEWSDNSPSPFRNWYCNYGPCSTGFYDNCAFTSQLNPKKWTNDQCGDTRSFYCYRFLILVKETKTWKEAQDYCKTHYTGLASVTTEASLRQLKLEAAQTQTESVWTGLHYINGQWHWTSREQLGSLISMPSCPGPSYHCGALNTVTNTVQNQNCNTRLNFICYWA